MAKCSLSVIFGAINPSLYQQFEEPGINLDGQETGIVWAYVVRNSGEFLYSDFRTNVAKYVRPGHVNSEVHWMNAPVEPNKLAE